MSKLLRVSSLVLLALLLASASYTATPPVLVISDSAGDSLTIDSTGTLTCVGSCSAAPATVTPGTVSCSVPVAPPVSASCVSITTNQGIAIVPVTLTASGGAGGPYTFTATGLPSGLTMSSSDIIDVLRETGRQRIRQPGSEDFIRAAR